MGFWDTAGRVGLGVATGGLSEAIPLGKSVFNSYKKDDQLRSGLQGGGMNDFGATTGDMDSLQKMLMARAQGGQSIAGLQGQQMLQQSLAQQQSMANSARPGNEAMAQRLSMQNQGNIGARVNSQTQIARLLEQQQNQQQLQQFLMGRRYQGAGMAMGASQMPSAADKFLGMLSKGAEAAMASQGGG